MEQKSTPVRVIAASLDDEILNNKPDYQKQINRVKSVYTTLEMGDFTDKVLTELINAGPGNILQSYEVQVKKEIAESGIKSARMKEILMQGYKDAEADLLSVHQALIDAVAAKRKELASQKILSDALIMNGTGFEKSYGHSREHNNEFKRLTIGKNSWISTTDGRSWGFEYSTVMMHPQKGDIYLYAICPANMGSAKLLVSYEPLPNTPTDYLVLIKKYDYLEIDFNK